MKTKLLSIIIYILISSNIYSDNIDGAGSCNTNLSDRGGEAFLTFFGDSLGDFVDSPIHGIFGWDTFLGWKRPEVQWRTQNLAVGGMTTRAVWNILTGCTIPNPPMNRENFITSNNVALEIGGNDMVYYIAPLIIFPWKFMSYVDPLTGKTAYGAVDANIHNTRAIIRFLRHPLIDKNVLLMGNFPGLSYSPTLGSLGDYFDLVKKLFNDSYLKIHTLRGPFGDNNDLNHTASLSQKILEVKIEDFDGLMRVVNTLIALVENTFASSKNLNISKLDDAPDPNSPLGWYLNWVRKMNANPHTVLTMGLLFAQPGLANMVNEEREITRNQDWSYPNPLNASSPLVATNRKGGDYVQFLPLYHHLVRWKDCLGWGECWVGEPVYFRDQLPGHINYLGYEIWSTHLANKFVSLGWQNDTTLRNDGKVKNFPELANNQPDIEVGITPVTPEVTLIDLLILYCFFFGVCNIPSF